MSHTKGLGTTVNRDEPGILLPTDPTTAIVEASVRSFLAERIRTETAHYVSSNRDHLALEFNGTFGPDGVRVNVWLTFGPRNPTTAGGTNFALEIVARDEDGWEYGVEDIDKILSASEGYVATRGDMIEYGERYVIQKIA